LSELPNPLRWLGLSVLLCSLLWQTPARTVGLLLPASVELEGFTGSLWQGQAARSRLLFGDKAFQLGSLSWSLSPRSLLSLTPSFDLNTRWGAQRLDLAVRFTLSGLEVRHLKGDLDVRFVRQLAPLYVGGQMHVDLQALDFHPGQVPEIVGKVLWRQAVWTARGGDVGLGNFQVTWSNPDRAGQPGEAIGEIVTLSGALNAAGEVAIASDNYRVNVTLTGPALNNEALRGALQMLASPDGEGLRIQLSGEL